MTCCSVAGRLGMYEEREVIHTISQGKRILVINHVPPEVCTLCGDVVFTAATVRRLEALRQTTAVPTTTMPLYDFTAPLLARDSYV